MFCWQLVWRIHPSRVVLIYPKLGVDLSKLIHLESPKIQIRWHLIPWTIQFDLLLTIYLLTNYLLECNLDLKLTGIPDIPSWCGSSQLLDYCLGLWFCCICFLYCVYFRVCFYVVACFYICSLLLYLYLCCATLVVGCWYFPRSRVFPCPLCRVFCALYVGLSAVGLWCFCNFFFF